MAKPTDGFTSATRWSPQNSAATVRTAAAAAVPQSSRLEPCTAHKASGRVNKIDPTNSADVQKSTKATSTVSPTIIATSCVRFIRHRNDNRRPTAISSSFRTRLGVGIGPDTSSEGRKGRPATVCRLSRRGIEVYTRRIRVQARLAGRCPIDYEEENFCLGNICKLSEQCKFCARAVQARGSSEGLE